MKITDTHIYFWNGIYSNWHPAQFVNPEAPDPKIVWANTEQAFMWYKAMQFGDLETAKKMVNTPDPRAVKKLGREVVGYIEEVWNDARYEAMKRVNMWKFTQNEDFKQELLDTDDKIIVEASPYDKIWGVGLLEDDPLILDENNWQGLNLLGRVIMDVRTELRKSA